MNPEVPKLLTRCNVCSAMDQIASQRGISPISSSSHVPQSVPQSVPQFAPQSTPQVMPHNRLSAGDLVLPKYIPFVATLAKKVFLRPGADAALSVIGSFLADAASGAFSDPQYKSALRALSDSLVDDIPLDDPNYVAGVKEDFLSIVEAYRKDGDIIEAMKKNVFRRPEDMFSIGSVNEHRSSMFLSDSSSRKPVKLLRPTSMID